MSVLDQVNRAIEYIERHICEPMTIDSIAQEAGMSKWHFQRSFRAMVGDTVKEYTLKRRLSLAAAQLLETEDKVIDIALAHEFDTHEVFTRAFKRAFSQSPTAFRRTRPAQYLIPHKPRITMSYLTHLYGGMNMQPVIKSIQEMTVVGMADGFKSVLDSETNNISVIPKLWRRFEEKRHKVLPAEKMATVGVIFCPNEHESSGQMEYVAGVVTDKEVDVPEGFVERKIPAGEYAEFIHRGPIGNINHTINYIYGSWLPKSGRERADGPEVEIYPPLYNPRSADAELKVLIPLK